MTDITLLSDIASEFREKFETEDLSQAPGFLPGFPKGYCSWATWMIGHFLKYELEEDDVLEIQAERVSDDGTDPHAWLVVDGVIVDIASDEFKDSAEKVIVTRDSQWHAAWTVKNTESIQRIETYDQIDCSTRLKPSDVYELLVRDIRAKYAHNKSLQADAAKPRG